MIWAHLSPSERSAASRAMRRNGPGTTAWTRREMLAGNRAWMRGADLASDAPSMLRILQGTPPKAPTGRSTTAEPFAEAAGAPVVGSGWGLDVITPAVRSDMASWDVSGVPNMQGAVSESATEPRTDRLPTPQRLACEASSKPRDCLNGESYDRPGTTGVSVHEPTPQDSQLKAGFL